MNSALHVTTDKSNRRGHHARRWHCTICAVYLLAKSFGGLGCPGELSRLGHAETGTNAGVGAGHGIGSEADGPHAVFLDGPVGSRFAVRVGGNGWGRVSTWRLHSSRFMLGRRIFFRGSAAYASHPFLDKMDRGFGVLSADQQAWMVRGILATL